MADVVGTGLVVEKRSLSGLPMETLVFGHLVAEQAEVAQLADGGLAAGNDGGGSTGWRVAGNESAENWPPQ
jgi:hypothetical protein